MKKRKIAICGAGAFGEYVYNILKYDESREIVCFLDNNASNIKREIPVWFVDELRIHLPEIEQIWLTVRNYYDMGDIVLQLHDLGVKEIWVVKPELWNKRLDGVSIPEIENQYAYYLDITEKAVISKLEFHVCDHCNLNCRGCSHFAPIFMNRAGYVQSDDFQHQMKMISQKFANIFRFRLMGGEPFLHKELDVLISIAREALPYTHLEIVTNGLLLKSVSDYIWDSIAENNAILNISLYPPTYKIRSQLCEILDAKGIEYSFGSGLEQYNEEGIIEEFHKCFTEFKIHDPITAAHFCMGKKCHYLRNGKISKCALPLLSQDINIYCQKNYVLEKTDYVDLEDTKMTPWDMVHRLHDATPFCAYCIEELPHRFSWKTGGDYQFDDYIIEEGKKR